VTIWVLFDLGLYSGAAYQVIKQCRIPYSRGLRSSAVRLAYLYILNFITGETWERKINYQQGKGWGMGSFELTESFHRLLILQVNFLSFANCFD